jgi:hypothetical protein
MTGHAGQADSQRTRHHLDGLAEGVVRRRAAYRHVDPAIGASQQIGARDCIHVCLQRQAVRADAGRSKERGARRFCRDRHLSGQSIMVRNTCARTRMSHDEEAWRCPPPTPGAL